MTIATLEQALGAFTTEGNIFVGYYDAFSSVSDNQATSFGLVDNLVVHDLGAGDEPPVLEITTINVSENSVELHVSFAGGETLPGATFTPSHGSPWSSILPTWPASQSRPKPVALKITTPAPNAGQQFYRVKF